MSVATSLESAWRYDLLTGAYFVGLAGILSSLAIQRHQTGPYGARNFALMTAGAATFACLAQWGSFILTINARVIKTVDSRTFVRDDFPLVFDAGLLALALIVSFIFALFAVFSSGHTWRGFWPSVIGSSICLAVGSALGTFIQFTSLRSLANSPNIDAGLAAGAAIVAVIGIAIGQAIFASSQASYKGGAASFTVCAIILSFASISMNAMAVASAKFSVNGENSLFPSGVSVENCLIIVWVFLSISLTSLIGSAIFSIVLRYRAPSSSSSVILSAFIMDGESRVLVTDSGDLPSYTLSLTYGAGFDSNHRDFLTMFQASNRWTAAFESMNSQNRGVEQSNGDDNEKIKVLTAMLEGCCALSNTLRIPVKELGIMFTEPVNERLLLLSQHTQAESRFTDNGTLRWVPVRALPDWQTRYLEIANFHRRTKLTLLDHALTPMVDRQAQTILIEIDKSSPASPRVRQSTLGSKSAPVAPIKNQSNPEIELAQTNIVKTIFAHHHHRAASITSEALATENNSRSRVFLSLFFTRIVGQSLQVMTAKKGAIYMTPMIRLNGENLIVGEEERNWLQQNMKNAEINEKEIAKNSELFKNQPADKFVAAFLSAVEEFSLFLGSGADLKFCRLHTPHPLNIGDNQILMFTVTVMSSQWPVGYDPTRLEFTPSKTFEILNQTKLGAVTKPNNWTSLCIAAARAHYQRDRAFDTDPERAWGKEETKNDSQNDFDTRTKTNTTNNIYQTITASMIGNHTRPGSRDMSVADADMTDITSSSSRCGSPRVSRTCQSNYSRHDRQTIVNGQRVTVVSMIDADEERVKKRERRQNV